MIIIIINTLIIIHQYCIHQSNNAGVIQNEYIPVEHEWFEQGKEIERPLQINYNIIVSQLV